MPKTVTSAQIASDPQAYEDQHVHKVYDQIASHFSSTRYKPWPIIAHFLSTLPTGSVGLDAGTGNGKYLPLPLDRPPGSICTIGLDRSRNLLEIARTARGDVDEAPTAKEVLREVIWGDITGNGWRHGVFDYAMSIATIHHLATYERRKLAVNRLIRCVSPSQGRILIYVWAIEQDELSRLKVPSKPRPEDSCKTTSGQDVFVPWVMSKGNTNKNRPKHIAKSRREEHPSSKITVAASSQSNPNEQPAEGLTAAMAYTPQVFDRYYHLFAEGELVELVRSAASDMGLHIASFTTETRDRRVGTEPRRRGLEIVRDGWERSNYYVELRCWEN